MATDAQLTHLAVLTSLNKMMRGGHFSICTIDAAIKAVGSVPDSRAYGILRTLHCVDWADMDPELRNAVPQLIERCLNVPAYQFAATPMTPEREALVQAGTLRLLTGGR